MSIVYYINYKVKCVLHNKHITRLPRKCSYNKKKLTEPQFNEEKLAKFIDYLLCSLHSGILKTFPQLIVQAHYPRYPLLFRPLARPIL